MKNINRFIILGLFLSDSLWARSLTSTVKKFGNEVSKVLVAFGIAALGFCAWSFLTGRVDASQRLNATVMGFFLIFGGPAIINFFQNLG